MILVYFNGSLTKNNTRGFSTYATLNNQTFYSRDSAIAKFVDHDISLHEPIQKSASASASANANTPFQNDIKEYLPPS
jgi:hypothetical protein